MNDNTQSDISCKELKNDWFKIIIFWLISIFVFNILGENVKNLYLILCICLFIFSTKSYFWIAICIVFVDSPGEFFWHHLIIIKNLQNITFTELVIVVAFIKSLALKRRTRSIKLVTFTPILIGLVLVILTSFQYEMSIIRFLRGARFLIYWTLIISIPALFKPKDFIKFFYIFIVFIPVFYIAQIYAFVNGSQMVNLINPSAMWNIHPLAGLYRSTAGVFALLISLMALFFFPNVFKRKTNNYLVALIIMGIFTTATRAWLASILFITIAYYSSQIIMFGYPFTRVFKFISIFLLILPLLFVIPGIKDQVNFIYARYMTIEDLLEGDMTAGGTLSRLDKRGPRVMKKVSEAPIFGFGISEDYWKYTDLHVGNQNMLLQGGIVGFSLWYLFLINMLVKFARKGKNRKNNVDNRVILISIVIFLIGMLTMHASVQVFNYSLGQNVGFGILLPLFLSFSYLQLNNRTVLNKTLPAHY